MDDLKLTDQESVAKMLREKKLYDLAGAAKATGYCVRYLRRLCHSRKIAHHRMLGRYYMTPDELAALLQPIKAK